MWLWAGVVPGSDQPQGGRGAPGIDQIGLESANLAITAAAGDVAIEIAQDDLVRDVVFAEIVAEPVLDPGCPRQTTITIRNGRGRGPGPDTTAPVAARTTSGATGAGTAAGAGTTVPAAAPAPPQPRAPPAARRQPAPVGRAPACVGAGWPRRLPPAPDPVRAATASTTTASPCRSRARGTGRSRRNLPDSSTAALRVSRNASRTADRSTGRTREQAQRC